MSVLIMLDSLCRFDSLLPFKLPREFDSLSEEFLAFQLLQRVEITSSVWSQAKVIEGDSGTHYRADILWYYLSTVRNPDHTFQFRRLSQVAQLVMVIPHSNAQEERVFSISLDLQPYSHKILASCSVHNSRDQSSKQPQVCLLMR